ncbi:phage integrase N-terminal SAM-like domain-containing protein [Liquorilactobacillus capillatus]|uniref:Integrase recombinase xerD n=1 Tax=Liquorilactobacillus capillatus DSM 19910 TaxID=1423731 RepID=A0A0R1LZR4_9LACO|nr:phage integrase N-terminal SAM-like domain-containing protein [Liquorilactobacillus capillatus]KRL01222.1 integrase recombinase xerD [Liquorilactobacillus capillatus DSM 19910]
MNYPYQQRFEKYLTRQMLAASTISSYQQDLNDFFNYLRHFNFNYQEKPAVHLLQESDIREYLTMLLVKRSVKYSTYNKVLSHLTRYFEYLFHENLVQVLPPLFLHGKKELKPTIAALDWPEKLEDLLADNGLSLYTRLTLLLCAHFYPVSEFLQPGFYTVLKKETLTSAERHFMLTFQTFIQPLQEKQKTADLFLKQRFDPIAPQLTLSALHKYLKGDAPKCPFPLGPQKLYQNAICHYLKHHQQVTDQAIMTSLHLTPMSLNYYRQLYWRSKN